MGLVSLGRWETHAIGKEIAAMGCRIMVDDLRAKRLKSTTEQASVGRPPMVVAEANAGLSLEALAEGKAGNLPSMLEGVG